MTILRNALKTALWIIRIIIPVSFVVTLLDFYGVIEWISAYTAPLFQLIGLQGNAAIVYFSSLFLPLYAPIAIIATLPLTLREITILALMCLITHNLPIECAVQRRSGTPFWQTLVIRLTFSILGGILLNLILPDTLGFNASPKLGVVPQAEGYENITTLNSQLSTPNLAHFNSIPLHKNNPNNHCLNVRTIPAKTLWHNQQNSPTSRSLHASLRTSTR